MTIFEQIEAVLRPLGYEPEPEKPDHVNGHDDGAADSPYWDLNKLALQSPETWLPQVPGLHNLVRVRGRNNWEATATWRESNKGRALEERKRNLKISPKGIKDFGTDESFSPLDLVMRGFGYSLSEAVAWLDWRVDRPTDGVDVDFEALAGSGSKPTAEENEAKGDAAREPKYRFKLVSYKDMRVGADELPYLVHELIPARGIVVVWGAPKCYKSFWLHDTMLHVAKGWEYHDRFVTQGAVVYCAFEGGHGYTKRIEAQRRHYEFDDNPPLYTMSGQANLISDHKRLVSEIRAQLGPDVRPVAVVLDTLNRSLVGSENNPVDMAAYTSAAESVREAFKCVVIIVHHCGWDPSRPRGHSSLPAAVDAELSVVREGDVATVTVQYMRDGPEGTQVVVKSKSIPVGTDASGRPLTSLVMGRHEGGADDFTTKPRTWAVSLKVFRSALAEAILSFGFDHKIPNGPTVKAVDLERVRAAFYKLYVVAGDEATSAEGQQNSRRMAFKRAVEKAQAGSLIGAMSEGDRQVIWFASVLDEGYSL
jgi:AAA domain